MDLQALIERIRSYYPEADVDLITKAYHFSRRAHEGQLRDSGEPYFQHPFEVAMILAELELDVETIAAGLLHDVLEDTEVTRAEMEAGLAEVSSYWSKALPNSTSFPSAADLSGRQKSAQDDACHG